jgi:CRP/FNR family cyclic AMP-dependent transcriptional regulator
VDRLLSQLSPPVKALALRGEVRSYRKNTVLVHEGEVGDSTFVLLDGRVKIFSGDLEGRELTYAIVEPGDYFAEMWLDGGPRSASAVTLEPCICSVVGGVAMREYLVSSPEFALELVTRVIRRARHATWQARELALKDVYGRLVSLLESHGCAAPGAAVTVSLTHQSLAARIGSSREMVSRILKDLERGGYVDLGVKRITLLRKLPSRW